MAEQGFERALGGHAAGGQGDDVILGSLAGGVLDSLPVAIAVFDLEGRILGFNATWLDFVALHFVGSPVEKLKVGARVSDVLPPNPHRDKIVTRYLREQAEGREGPVRENGVRVEHDGVVSYYDAVLAPFKRGGETVGLVQVLADATERVQAHQMLETRVDERTVELERRREVAEGLHAILTVLNSCCPEGQVLNLIVSQARRLLGCQAVGIYQFEVEDGQTRMAVAHGIEADKLAALRLPVDRGIVAETLLRRLPMPVSDVDRLFGQTFESMPPEQQALVRGAFQGYASLLAVPLLVAGDVYGCVAMYYSRPREFSSEDISVASDLADHLALALENAALRRETEETAAVEERNRLARDLHDAVTQTLFSASLIAEVLPRIWDKDETEGRKRVEELRRLTRGALAEMRALLVELRPVALIEGSLSELLSQLIESATGKSGIDAGLSADDCSDLPADVRVVIYRIVQEALNNISKHSQARHAEVLLAREADKGVRLTVTDDGRGFAGTSTAEHLGLRIMQERAATVGAKVRVKSAPERGTRVEFEWHPDKEA